MANYPQLVAPARADLKAQEQAGVAEKQIAAWRRIVMLLETGELILGDNERPADAWPPLVAAAQASLEHRVGQCGARPSGASERRISALWRIRAVLIESAIISGAKLPSFDNPPAEERSAA